MLLSDLSIKQPVFATMLMVGLVVLGIFSYKELSTDLFPNVDLPVVSVSTLYPGVSPETVETEVTKRIEEAINPIQGPPSAEISITCTSTANIGGCIIPTSAPRPLMALPILAATRRITMWSR